MNNIKDCPWKGFKSYEESDADLFKGRAEDVKSLLSVVTEHDISVLYATSGAGKSSIIKAGLYPQFRRNQIFPISIIFPFDNPQQDFTWDRVEDYEKFVKDCILQTISIVNEEYKNKNIFFSWDCIAEGDASQERICSSLWWMLRNSRLCCKVENDYEIEFKIIFVFDQFERIFTQTKSEQQKTTLFSFLKEIVINRIPERFATNPNINNLKLDCNAPFKILLSMRDDYIGQLDDYAAKELPSVQNNRYCLRPLSVEQAEEIITGQGINTLNDAKDEIINKVKEQDHVSAILLSVLCKSLYDNARTDEQGEKEKISIEDVEINTSELIYNFYCEQIKKTHIKGHRKEIEHILIDDEGKRKLIPLDRGELRKVNFKEKYQKELEDNGIIHIENIKGEKYVELIHDRVAEAIFEKRFASSDVRKYSSIVTKYAVALFVVMLTIIFFSIFSFDNTQKNKIPLFYNSEIWPEDSSNFSNEYVCELTVNAIESNVYDCKNLCHLQVGSKVKNLSIKNCPSLVSIYFEGDSLNCLSMVDCPIFKWLNLPLYVGNMDGVVINLEKITSRSKNLISYEHSFGAADYVTLWDVKRKKLLYSNVLTQKVH